MGISYFTEESVIINLALQLNPIMNLKYLRFGAITTKNMRLILIFKGKCVSLADAVYFIPKSMNYKMWFE